MLYKCNILALVGGGDFPKYPMNKVVIWDDHQSKAVAELSFKSDIKLVKLKAEKIIVSLEDRIYVYHFTDMKLIDLIETCKNPDGKEFGKDLVNKKFSRDFFSKLRS